MATDDDTPINVKLKSARGDAVLAMILRGQRLHVEVMRDFIAESLTVGRPCIGYERDLIIEVARLQAELFKLKVAVADIHVTVERAIRGVEEGKQ